MKLGTQTDSVVNHLYSRMTIGEPKATVGMGATILSWSDRYAATVTNVDGNRVTVQRDHAKRVDSNGVSESQDYEYAPDPHGAEYVFRKARSGQWEEVFFNAETGRWNKSGGYGLRIGKRRQYRDFTF